MAHGAVFPLTENSSKKWNTNIANHINEQRSSLHDLIFYYPYSCPYIFISSLTAFLAVQVSEIAWAFSGSLIFSCFARASLPFWV
jgi:hypothetical protein